MFGVGKIAIIVPESQMAQEKTIWGQGQGNGFWFSCKKPPLPCTNYYYFGGATIYADFLISCQTSAESASGTEKGGKSAGEGSQAYINSLADSDTQKTAGCVRKGNGFSDSTIPACQICHAFGSPRSVDVVRVHTHTQKAQSPCAFIFNKGDSQ